VLSGIKMEGRLESTRREEEPKRGRGLRMKKREAKDKTRKQIDSNRGSYKGSGE